MSEPVVDETKTSKTATGDTAAKAASPSRTAASHEGGRQSGERTMNFRQRVALSFGVVSIATTLIFVIVLTLVWGAQFKEYTRTTLDELAATAATTLGRYYDTRGYWSTSNLESTAASAVGMDDIGVQICNAAGVSLYDSTVAGSSGVSGIADELSLAPDSSDNVVERDIVTQDGTKVGTVRVWVYGSDVLLTQRDERFQSSTIGAIGLAGFLAALTAMLIGMWLSKLLTSPLRTISGAAQRIKEGDLTARSNVRGDDDLGQLGETFDSMADSIERDRALERRLTTDVAHELRTPLMSIISTTEAMQDEILPCDQEHLALVASETRRLSRLVDSMLRLSRLENGSVRLNIETVDAVEFVSNIATAHSMLFEDTGLHMTFCNKTGVDSLPAEFDRDTVTQAVTNILGNAMRYTPSPGEVEVGIGREGENFTIWVRDTGIGIAPEDIGNVFGRFWRAEESRTRVSGGLGVGLAVTKEIVDRHHGHIDVTSELGVGTTFTLVLPLVQPKVAEQA